MVPLMRGNYVVLTTRFGLDSGCHTVAVRTAVLTVLCPMMTRIMLYRSGSIRKLGIRPNWKEGTPK